MIAECPIMKREALGSQLTDYLPHPHHTRFITQAWPTFISTSIVVSFVF